MPEPSAPGAPRRQLPAWQVAAWSPERPALLWAGGRLSYGQLCAAADRLADLLEAQGPGDGGRVALLPDRPLMAVVGLLSLWRLGAQACPLNLRLSPAEWSAQLARLRPSRLLASPSLADACRVARDGGRPLVALPDERWAVAGDPGSDGARGHGEFDDARGRGELDGAQSRSEPSGARDRGEPDDAACRTPGPAALRPPDPDAPALLLFSSGTSGQPKLVLHSHGAMTAHAGASALRLGHGPDDLWLLSLPLYHIGGIALLQRALAAGGAVALSEGGDAAAVADALRRWPVSQLSLVPTQLVRLLELWPGEAPASLRAVLLGGAAADPALVARARRRGWPIALTYGLTEAGSQVATGWPSRDPTVGAAAFPLPGTRVEVRDAAGEALPPGAAGEIWVRGPGLMLGYADDPAASAAALRDGWLRTGDWGRLDGAGRLSVDARREDLIISGGENLLPEEVEEALCAHPWIAEAAVVGIDDAVWGQVVAAALVLHPKAAAEQRGLADLAAVLDPWLRPRLAAFKRPRRYLVLDALPRGGGGKLLRGRLRALLAAAPAANAAR